jgi:DNA-binding IclR family transcriptional regulator
MKVSSTEKVMSAVQAIVSQEHRISAYGPELITKTGLSSTTVYSALRELVAHGMLEHRYHSGPYYLTEKSR